MMMWPNMMGGFFGGGLGIAGMILTLVFTALFITGIIILIVWLVKRANSYGVGQVNNSSAIEILKKRYAGGEINKKEFENMKKDIG